MERDSTENGMERDSTENGIERDSTDNGMERETVQRTGWRETVTKRAGEERDSVRESEIVTERGRERERDKRIFRRTSLGNGRLHYVEQTPGEHLKHTRVYGCSYTGM